jgi:hypothetical protein
MRIVPYRVTTPRLFGARLSGDYTLIYMSLLEDGTQRITV